MSGTRRKPGRMGPFVFGFQTSLSEQGYSVLAVRNMWKDVGALGRWMQERDLQPSQLAPARDRRIPQRSSGRGQAKGSERQKL